MIKQIYGKGKGIRQRIILLTLVAIMLITNCLSISASYGDDLQKAAANDWQISEGKYKGNEPENKTTVSNDGMVRIQKNVIPTDTENNFLVYMSLDVVKRKVITYEKTTRILQDDKCYVGDPSNVLPKESIDVGKGSGYLYSGVHATEKEIQFEEGKPTFIFQILYQGQLIAEPKLQNVVPNSCLYIKAGTGQYILLANIKERGKRILVNDEEVSPLYDKTYLVTINLSDKSYEALFNFVSSKVSVEESVVAFGSETTATITDPMGDYIIYDGVVNADIFGETPVAASEAGTTVNWNLKTKAEKDIEKTDPVVTSITESNFTSADGTIRIIRTITTEQWCLNVAEIVYKVHLDVEKQDFKSGDVYAVNGTTVLNYQYNEEDRSVEFPVPKVIGTLYDFSFNKVDEDDTSKVIKGAKFVLSDGKKQWSATEGSENGNWKFENLPWGTYTLTETEAPAGYTLGDNNPEWTLKIGYTEDLKDGNVSDHVHNETENDVFTGKNDETGKWNITNTPKVYKVTYEVLVDSVYGQPKDSKAPVDSKDYKYNDQVIVKGKLTTTQNYAEKDNKKISGVWTFDSWNEDSFQITENTTLKGSWKFTPSTYTLSYEIVGTGPTDATLPDKMENISFGANVELAEDLKTEWNTLTGKNDGGTQGKWKFIGWSTDETCSDNLGSITIEKDEIVYGKWQFTANTYTLSYEVVGTGPTDATLPDKMENIAYGTVVTLAADLLTEWNTLTGKNDGGTPGQWNFIGWSTDETCSDNLDKKTIEKNETVYGKWEFTSTATTVTVNKVWVLEVAEGRPSYVEVQLYCDNVAYGDVVILNDENSWMYTWSNLDNRYAWTVDEINVPTGFKKTVVQNENVWTITNTMLLEPIPHTGDLLNPTLIIALMVLSCLGIIGVAIHAKRKD